MLPIDQHAPESSLKDPKADAPALGVHDGQDEQTVEIVKRKEARGARGRACDNRDEQSDQSAIRKRKRGARGSERAIQSGKDRTVSTLLEEMKSQLKELPPHAEGEKLPKQCLICTRVHGNYGNKVVFL